ncbi:MAG TPA: hypothetical protein VGP15_11940, partial [Burkholderiales bacterium]|nr:hypothetical protein [Burkholderiales bacterium]
HEQNIILADVRKRDLFAVWQAAKSQGLATPNVGLLTNIVCCPGGDFCSLANAKSIPIAEAIQQRFDDLDYLHEIGELDLNISGCMNACGHHHVGHIGILGVDKQGSEWYQVSIGGSQGNDAALGLATPNIGMITNIISCPGGDFCSLANAKSIPVAEAIQRCFDDLDFVYDIGELDLNISGCMNSCGHHHIGHIGILGVDKQGAEFYQISIGGAQGNQASLGKVLGPSVSQNEVPDVIEKLIAVYLERRDSEAERFIDVVRRIGLDPFKENVYGAHQGSKARARPLATA